MWGRLGMKKLSIALVVTALLFGGCSKYENLFEPVKNVVREVNFKTEKLSSTSAVNDNGIYNFFSDVLFPFAVSIIGLTVCNFGSNISNAGVFFGGFSVAVGGISFCLKNAIGWSGRRKNVCIISKERKGE